jgi:outer membrane protein
MTAFNSRTALAAALLIAMAAGAAAQNAGADSAPLILSVDEAVELGIRSNLTLRSERLGLEEKKLDKDSGWNVFLPKASLRGAMARSNISDADRSPLVPRLGAQVALDLSLGISAGQFAYLRQTALDYERGLISLDMAEKNLRRDIKKLYLGLLLAKGSLGVLEDDLALAERRLEQARVQLRIGASTELALLSEEVNVESLRPRILEGESGYQTALGNLRLLLGIGKERAIELSGSLDQALEAGVGEEEALGRLASRLDLAYLRNAIASLRNKLKGDYAALAPAFFAQWTADRTFMFDLAAPSSYSGKSVAESWKETQGALTLGVSIPLDVFAPGSGAQTSIRKSRLQIAETELAYKSAQDAAEIELRSLLRSLETSATLIAAADKNVALGQRLYDLTDRSYSLGSRTFLELQDALNKLNALKFARLKAKYDYLVTLADLEHSMEAGDFAR